MVARFLGTLLVSCIGSTAATKVSPWSVLPRSGLGPGAEEWARSEPEDEGLDSGVLAAAAAGVIEDLPGRQCWLVIRHGMLVQEEYYRGVGPDTLYEGDSAMKVATSLVVGVAWTKGLVDLDRPLADYGIPPGDPWRQVSARAFYPSLTARHLLSQVSGLGYALPGTAFTYSSDAAIQHLEKLLAHVTGTNHTADWATEHLAKPLGIPKLFASDGKKLSIGGGQMATCRDFARIGQLILNEGSWRDSTGATYQLVDQRYMRMMGSPSFPTVSVTHGFLLWISQPRGQYGPGEARCCYPRWGFPYGCSYDGSDENYHIYKANGTMLGDDFWLDFGTQETVYFALGWLSKLIFMLPARDMIVVTIGNTMVGSSLCDFRYRPDNGDQAYALSLVWRRLLPALPALPLPTAASTSTSSITSITTTVSAMATTAASTVTVTTTTTMSMSTSAATTTTITTTTTTTTSTSSTTAAGPTSTTATATSIASVTATPVPTTIQTPLGLARGLQLEAFQSAASLLDNSAAAAGVGSLGALSDLADVRSATTSSSAGEPVVGGCYCYCKPDQGFGSCFEAPAEASETNDLACQAFAQAAAKLCPAVGILQECRVRDPTTLQWVREEEGRRYDLPAIVDPCATDIIEQQDFHCRPVRRCGTAEAVNGSHGDYGTCLCEARFVECSYDATPCDRKDPYLPRVKWPPRLNVSKMKAKMAKHLAHKEKKERNKRLRTLGAATLVAGVCGLALLAPLACACWFYKRSGRRLDVRSDPESQASPGYERLQDA